MLLYSPNGSLLAAGEGDGLVRLWDAETGELQITLSGHKGSSWVTSFSSDGTRLFTTSNDETIKEWDLSPSKENIMLTGKVGSGPFSPDGLNLALSRADGSLEIVDTLTGEVVKSWQAHSDWIEDLAWSPDGTRLATSNGRTEWTFSEDTTTRVWDTSSGQLLKEIPGNEYGGFTMLAWSPDANRLVTSSFYTSTNLIWDTTSWNLLYTLPSPDANFALAYSPDGQKIATSSMTDLFIWDATTGEDVFTQTLGHTAMGLAFSPDGKRLAATQTTGSIFLFKITGDGAQQEQILSGGDQMVTSVAFSPDGALLATGDISGKVRVWDLKTYQIRLVMAPFTDLVRWVAFSPDSRRLVASSESGAAYYYVLPVVELIDLARSRIILPMTKEECWEYLETETCPEWP